MRSPNRRRHATLAALTAGILITAGCGGDGGGENTSGPQVNELYFQRADDQGPDPFTPSTAMDPPKGAARTGASPEAEGDDSYDESGSGRTARALPGSTAGLYGGVQAVSSCDVERQIQLLTEDEVKAGAFAQGARVGQESVPEFLRGLTPVFLRADIRMSNHGFRDGAAAEFQSVLQAGTAVLVDGHGLPRVRCTGGSPLRPPIVAQGSMTHRGNPWPGYRPERVVVIDRTTQPLSSLILVDTVNNDWIERLTGTHGEADGRPGATPAYGPDADITDPNVVRTPEQPSSGIPGGPRQAPAPEAPAPGRAPGGPARQGDGPLTPPSQPDAQPDLQPDGGSGADADEQQMQGLLIGPISFHG
ncbi:DUF6777 domain-containing protein [Streptomyces sp. NPDC056909]|uniref:DUF6777 domain-containing protein n=1 Tax=Streptomyces sp. NPDC056909 TaxID=3345963 RepID=UPI0036A2DC6B